MYVHVYMYMYVYVHMYMYMYEPNNRLEIYSTCNSYWILSFCVLQELGWKRVRFCVHVCLNDWKNYYIYLKGRNPHSATFGGGGGGWGVLIQ